MIDMRHRLLLLLLFPLLYIPVAAQPSLETRTVIGNLDTPWEILWGPDNYIWMTERPGRVSRLNPTTGERKVLLTLTDVTESDQMEAGLLGMALHPNFFDTSIVYLVYTYRSSTSGNILEKLVSYRLQGDTLVSPTILLGNIPGNQTHDGSRIIIHDHAIYMTVGDAQIQSAPQNTNSINGKILRLNFDGRPAIGNPYFNSTSPANLVWSKGHRNPQGLVMGPNGILYSSEHGSGSDDEINIIEKGRNFGWPNVEGYCNTPAEQTYCNDSNIVQPITAWSPTLATAGLDYYAHTAIPQWTNSLLLVTLKEATLHQLKLSPDGRSIVADNEFYAGQYGRLRDLCIAPDGRVFIATSNRDGRGSPIAADDRIIEIKAAAAPTASVAITRLTPLTGTFEPGGPFAVIYQTQGTFDGSNLFVFQLSDSAGSFASPRQLGTITGTSGDSILFDLPCDLASSTSYRVRIIGSSPSVTSEPSDPFRVTMPPTTIGVGGGATICEGDSALLSAPDGYNEYLWSTGARTQRITVRRQGVYSVTMSTLLGCSYVTSQEITVEAAPTGMTVTNVNGTLSTEGGYASYQWYRNGVAIPGANDRTYRPTQPGRYSVVVTNRAGCSNSSSELTVETVGVTETQEPAGSLSLYPHPAREKVTLDVQVKNASDLAISLSSIDGVVVRSMKGRAAPSLSLDIPIADLPAGVYMLTVETKDGRWVRKVVVGS